VQTGSHIAFIRDQVLQRKAKGTRKVRGPALLIDITEEVHTDVILESPVQGWVFLREFERGLDCYKALEEKTGADDRWAGVCYFHLRQDLRAVELFYRAIARGVEAARINLAHALAYIERGDEVIPELLKVDRNRLTTYDKVLFYRVKSLHEETSGDLLTALGDAETAWELVQGASQFSILAPDILSQLAVLNGRIGRAQVALAIIDKNLSMSSGVDALRARIARGHILITLGKFAEAVSELRDLDLSIAPEDSISIVHVYLGEAEWALGNMHKAVKCFERAVEAAAELNFGFEEFSARVGLALLLAYEGNRELAFEHIKAAEHLVGDRSDRLYFRFREILLHRLAGTIGAADAIAELRTVAHELGKMGALQEQGWVWLHIASELWLLDDPDFERELGELQKLAAQLQNPEFLSRELALLPQFSKVAREKLSGATRQPTLTVRTLDDEGLALNGEPIRLPLRRSVELLAYFLEHSQVSLDKLIADLFPKEKVRTAKSYFHQFRYQLSRKVPGLRIKFNPSTQCYSLSSDITIVWDVEALRAGDNSLRGRTFLESATSAWAEEMDQKLSQLRFAGVGTE
jgi:tetratricopeptide (TPR) repeat protein